MTYIKRILIVAAILAMCTAAARAQEVPNGYKMLWAADIVKSYISLDAKEAVPVEYLTTIDQMKQVLREYEFGEMPEDKVGGFATLASRFGFTLLEEYSLDELVKKQAYGMFGLYDEKKKIIYVITDELFEQLRYERFDQCDIREDSIDMMQMEDWRRKHLSDTVLVHLTTYALQDQYNDLADMYKKFRHNDDALQAIQAMSTGQADLVRETYMKEYLNVMDISDFLHRPDDAFDISAQEKEYIKESGGQGPLPNTIERKYKSSDYGANWTIESIQNVEGGISEHFSILGEDCDDELDYFWWRRNFPFIYGGRFMLKLREEKGWKATNDAFVKCPLSTEQIVNSEKYFDKQKEDLPTFINLPSFDDILDQDTWKYLDYNTVGQAQLYLICKTLSFDWKTTCIDSMKGWDGDRFVAWENKYDDILMAAYTTWDSPEDAQEFYHFYDEAWSARGVSAGKRSSGKNWLIIEAGEESMYMEVRDNDVITVEGELSKEQMKQFAERLWTAEKYEASYDICTMSSDEFVDEYPGNKE